MFGPGPNTYSQGMWKTRELLFSCVLGVLICWEFCCVLFFHNLRCVSRGQDADHIQHMYETLHMYMYIHLR